MADNNRKHKLIFVILAVAAIGIILGVIHMVTSFGRVMTDDAYIDGRVHQVAFKVPGTVLKLHVDDNQDVKKGDLLIELDPADYELKVKEANSAVEAEKSRLADAEAGIRTAAANLAIQQVTLNQAQLDMDRGEKLFQKEVITKERHEKITTALELAKAQLVAAEEQLSKAKAVRDLEGSLIKQKQATSDINQLNMSYTKLYSSSDGYVTRRSVEAGNQVQAGQPLMAVVDLGDIWLVANYKETQLEKVKAGQDVTILVDTYPGKVFKGKVDSIMAGTGAAFSLFPAENALGNYVKVVQRVPVKITFDKDWGANRQLRVGMSCIPTILTK